MECEGWFHKFEYRNEFLLQHSYNLHFTFALAFSLSLYTLLTMKLSVTLVLIISFTALLVAGCKEKADTSSKIQTINGNDADLVGNHIAELLSIKCPDGYHFGNMGDPLKSFPTRVVKMVSSGPLEGEDKFLGYQWKGMFEIGVTWRDNHPTGGTG